MPSALHCLFAKPPEAGRTKTRLAKSIGAEGAAQLAQAFLHDTWDVLGATPGDRLISSTVADPTAFALSDVRVYYQGGGDLGARIERTLQHALSTHDTAFAVGADVPSLTVEGLAAAQRALADHDAVLGPTSDGGFWVLGVRRCPAGLLADLPWSAANTADATLRRLRSAGVSTAVLPQGWDVDEPEDLVKLAAWLAENPGKAPATRRVLALVWDGADGG